MLGIYGGTFDPVHYGHLRTALEVKEAIGLDALRFVPCRLPPHRGRPGATPEQRLALLEAALAASEPGFGIDPRELERSGPSYMVDTLASLRDEIGSEPLCLIVGQDAFLGLNRWHRWRQLLELAHVVVMRRPGSGPAVTPELADVLTARLAPEVAALRRQPAGCIHCVEVTQLEISATRLRAAVAAGRSLRYLTPDPVIRLILELGLYRPPDVEVS